MGEKNLKKEKVSKEKKGNKSKKQSFFKAVKQELKKVKWPERKEVVKYTIATIIFIIIFVVLFALLNLGISVIKGLFV